MYRIFLADDEVWVTIGLKKLIKRTGLPFYVVGEATNGILALETILDKRPDVLIVDIRMPGYNGLELMEKMVKEKLDTKVIVLSGYAEFEYARTALRLGAVEYLLKPVKYDQLEHTLKSVLRMFEEEGNIAEESFEEETEPFFLEEIIKKLKENYTEDITLTILAEQHNISISHLSALVKEELGMSYSEYVTSKRIQKAKELLTNRNLSVNQVGEMVGYKDYYYFNKVFKKETGLTPGQYRKNQ